MKIELREPGRVGARYLDAHSWQTSDSGTATFLLTGGGKYQTRDWSSIEELVCVDDAELSAFAQFRETPVWSDGVTERVEERVRNFVNGLRGSDPRYAVPGQLYAAIDYFRKFAVACQGWQEEKKAERAPLRSRRWWRVRR